MPNQTTQRKFITRLLIWYKHHGRILPWRGITNPYRILVSEIMLQQTQVSRVLIKYPEFLQRYPTLLSIAKALQRDIVTAWEGMGYNNRAIRLHRLARDVKNNFHGRFPSSEHELLSLPGIGRYTANAIRSSAFGEPVPVVDVNVRRLFSRMFWRLATTAEMRPEKEIWSIAAKLIPKKRAYTWNQAVMDFGATICTARQPKCGACPVAPFCLSRQSMQQELKRHPKTEPSRQGIPNRIYRGRIVQELRETRNDRSITIELLGRRVFKGFSKRDHQWLRSIMGGLQKDGVIRISGSRSLKTQRVSLA